MPSTYSTSLRLELIGNGEQAGNWGNTNNINLGTLLEQAIAGVENVAISGTSYTLTTGNGVSDQARNAVIVLTGTLSANCNVIVPSVDKTYTFRNATTGGFSVVVKTAAGSGVTIANGYTQNVYCDATNVIAAGAAFNNTSNTMAGNLVGNVIGNVSASAGTAATPSVSFSGDTDTGIYNPSAGELAVSLNGSDAYRARASGVRHQFYGLDGATIHLISGTTRGVRITTDASSANIEGVDQTGVATYQPIALKGSELVFATGSSPTERLRISASGQLQNNAGTAAAPAYSFSGDTDTGIYSPGAGQIALVSNGVLSLLIDANGNIGINYGNMAALGVRHFVNGLSGFAASATGSVSLGSRTNFTSTFENASGGYGLGAQISSSTGAVTLQSQRFDGSATAYDVALNPLGGNVGVGTASPLSKLHVAGDARVTGDLLMNSGYGSAAIAYGVRAWASVTIAAGVPTMDANGNFTSITDNGVGDFTFNFSNNMPDTHYAIAGSAVGQTNTGGVQPGLAVNTANGQPLLKSTSQVRIGLYRLDANAYADAATFSIMVVR